ncbi:MULTISPECIES: hypothetical protein [unclassified Moorena]|uniref:hypothetical protein n=1 Tax=unclassified Moorena TaxID=2683338 RepID=UPI0013FFB780|nr:MULTISPECIES: hypothetical protein [unclassified Moorena]NEO15932.1 hypothetical protein [Moorena sp. SIO3E8]NEQ02482.1 hypothetical protein [Moorena sp. SIO3F7]
MITKAMQRLHEGVSPTRALHQDNTFTRSLIKTTLANRPRDRVQLANLGLWPRYANSLQPCPIGHAIAFNLPTFYLPTCQPANLPEGNAKGEQPANLGQ